MTFGFRARQMAALTITAATVALTAGLIHAALLVRSQVADVQDRAESLAKTLAHTIGFGRDDAAFADRTALMQDSPEARRYAEGVLGYSSLTLYVAIRDSAGIALLHTIPSQEGKPASGTEPFPDFASREVWSQLWSLAFDNRALVAKAPLVARDGSNAGSVEVAVSTLFLRHQLSRSVAVHALISAAVTLLAFLGSFLVANRLLAPIEQLRRELRRIDPGEGQPKLDLRTRADVGRLIEFFANLSDRVTRAEGEGDEKTSVRTMLAGLGDAVLVLDRQGRILSGNEEARRLVHSGGKPIEGSVFQEIVPAGHPLRSLLDHALDQRPSVLTRVVSLRVGEEAETPHRVEIRALGSRGSQEGFLLMVRDVQRVSRLGSQLSHSRKLAALGRLTSGVAHEIRNPLNALVLQAAVLKFKLGERDDDVRKHVAILEKEVRNLDRIIDGFMKFTRPEEGPLEPVQLHEVVGETVELMRARAEQAKVRFTVEVPAGLPPVSGSADLLRQVFVNLFGNSMDAMPEGGELRVRAEPAKDGGVVVAVHDTGVGIPAEQLPKVFNLFHTTKAQGSGIGLSLVYRIIQYHGGEIAIDSEPGAGTRVTMTFPDLSS